MAELTENLPQYSVGAPNNPGQQAVSNVVSSLTEAASTGLDIYSGFKSSQVRKAKLQQEADKKNALNQTASGIFSILAKADQNTYQIPTDVVSGVNKLQTVQKAETAGKYPEGTTSLQLEQFVQSVMQRHPANAAEVFSYIKEKGFDHYMFQGLEAQQDYQKAIQQSKAKQDADWINLGRKAGGLSLPDDQALVLGQTLSAKQYEMETSKAVLDSIDKRLDIDDRQKSALKSQLKDNQLNTISTILNKQAVPILDQFYKYMDGAMSQPEFDKQVKDSIPQINLSIESIRNQMHSAAARMGATPDEYKFIDDQIDGYKKHLTDVVQGDLSQYGQLRTGAEAMKTKLGVDSATAYPLATKLKSLIGPGWVNLFGGDPTYGLPKETLDALKSEMKGVKDWNTPRGQATIQDIVSAAKGQLNIKSVPADRVPGLVRGVMGTLKGSQEAIVNKTDTSLQNQGTWFNNYSNVLNWSRNFTPNSPDTKGMLTSAQLLFNPGARTVIGNYMANADGKEKAQALIQGSRSVAIQMINAVANNQDFGPVKVTYDPKAGQFKTNVDVPGSRSQAAVQAANLALDHLIQTDQFEKELPQGATPLSRRNYWVTGNAKALQDAMGKPLFQAKTNADGTSNSEDFKKSLADFNKRLREIPLENNSVMPQHIANAQIEQESGWQNGIKSVAGAVGVAQIRPSDWPEYDAEKLKNDPAYALKARDEIMGKLLKKWGGNIQMALAEYHAGPDFGNWGPKTFKYVASILNKSDKGTK